MAKLQALHQYLPTVVLWNRLEGRPRTANFDRAMKAEVRDALWMISKQWQIGEFIGDDAGSPVLARAHLGTTRLAKYRGGETGAEPFDESVPLEAKVETQPIQFTRRGQEVSLDVRLLMGRRWLRQVSAVGPGLKQAYVEEYEIRVPDPTIAADADVCAHSPVWQQIAAVAGRAMDGYEFYDFLVKNGTDRAHEGIIAAEVDRLVRGPLLSATGNRQSILETELPRASVRLLGTQGWRRKGADRERVPPWSPRLV
jgi:hypothetical protein